MRSSRTCAALLLAALCVTVALIACGAPSERSSAPNSQSGATSEIVGSLPTPAQVPAERPTDAQAANARATTLAKQAATLPSQINGFKTISAAKLPPEARATLVLIEKGGPFPYRQDGQVFQNRERILPKKQSGYYHEYTVETPGSDDRGARRIITGRNGEYYYTDDHYSSFRIIVFQ